MFFDKTARDMDARAAQMVLSYQQEVGHEKQPFIPTSDNIQKLLDKIDREIDRAGEFEEALWRNHFTGFLQSFRFKVNLDRLLPYDFVARQAKSLYSLIRSDPRPRRERESIIEARIEGIPAILNAVTELLPQVTEYRRGQLRGALDALRTNLKLTAEWSEDDGASSNSRLIESALQACDELQQSTEDCPLPEQGHQFELDDCLREGMQVPFDYIYSWYEEEVQRTRSRFLELASAIDPKKDPMTILSECPQGFSSQEELFSETRRIIGYLRAAALNYVTLPEGESCDVIATPEERKMSCPTAHYSGTSPLLDSLTGNVGLNVDNLSHFTLANLEGTLSHEVYPGHHTHGVKTTASDLPLTFKIRLPGTRCLSEGVAHRSETLMIPYFEDPIAELASAHRSYYCAYRVKAEVELYHHHKPKEEVMNTYIEDLGTNEFSARGQLRAHMMFPADAVSYYTGMKYLRELREDSSLSKSEFIDETFSYGKVTLETMSDILSLPTDKREALKKFYADEKGSN